MSENKQDSGGVLEIDLRRIAETLLHKIWLIVLMSVVGAVAAFVFTYYFVTPQYQSSAMFYVNNSEISLGDTVIGGLSASDISASRGLVESHIVILKARTTLNDIIDCAGISRTPTELRQMISAAPVNSTEIFEVVVTGPDPYEAERIASAIAEVLPKRIETIVEGSSAKVVDTAIVPVGPSSPSYTKNVIVGFLLFMMGTVGVIVLRLLFDTTIRTEESVAQLTSYPVLASIPNMLAPGKGKYYAYDSNKAKDGSSVKKKEALLGDDVSFVASEAYKLLRTKLQFSFTDDGGCRVLGLSSAMAGEGKSLTSVNLAYSLAQLNKRVILIDCDMRRPTLAEKMKLRKTPGLSNWLTGQENISELLQRCSLKGDKGVFDVISAGQTPPNPIELLSSEKMAKTLALLRKSYDYILLDLPPVGEVSDALAVAGQVDGMLLVVRQDYCNRHALMDTVNQFEFIESKILGVVYNCASESGNGYGYKSYYKKYGYRYYSKHGSGKHQGHKSENDDRNKS